MRRSTGTTSAQPPALTTVTPHQLQTSASHPHPQIPTAASSLSLLESGALISALLLNPTHDSVRSLAVSMLKQLCLGTPHMTIRLATRLAAMLPQASAAGQDRPALPCVQHNLLIFVYCRLRPLHAAKISKGTLLHLDQNQIKCLHREAWQCTD